MDAVILAGGRGSRLGLDKNKSLLNYSAMPLLEHTIKMVDPYVEKIVVVGGHYVEDLYEYQQIHKKIEIVCNQQGVVSAIRQGIEAAESDHVLLAFGDEHAVSPRVQQLEQSFLDHHAVAAIGYCVRNEFDQHLIHNTFSIEVNNDRVTNTVEKPRAIVNNMQGTGYAVLSKKILEYIYSETLHYPAIIQNAIWQGETVVAVDFCDEYFNNNTQQDLDRMKRYEMLTMGHTDLQ